MREFLLTTTSISVGSNNDKHLRLRLLINYKEVSLSSHGRAGRSLVNAACVESV